jgi:hypothetical protein
MHAVLEVELGDLGIARKEWSNLIRAVPHYTPARDNFITLDAMSFGALGKSIRLYGRNESSEATTDGMLSLVQRRY